MALLPIACHTQAVYGGRMRLHTRDRREEEVPNEEDGGGWNVGYTRKTVFSVVCAPKAIKVNFLIE